MRKIISVTVVALLAGCGGGGGASSGGTGGPPVTAGLTASQSTIDLTQYEGTSASTSLVINAGKPLPTGVNWAIQEVQEGLFNEKVAQVNAEGALQAYLSGRDGLAVGTHQGSVAFKLCEDDVATCAKPVVGSPLVLPVRITVKQFAPNLTPTSIIQQLGVWGSYHGSGAHTGYLPASFATADFSARWRHRCRVFCSRLPVVSADGVVFQVGAALPRSDLTAIDEASGIQRWRVELDNEVGHAPVLANGKLYLATNSKLGTFLRVIDPKTGAELAKKPFTRSVSTAPYEGPVVGPDGGIYLYETAGLTKRDANGEVLWTTSAAGDVGDAVAVDARAVYAYSEAKLTILDANDGRVVSQISVPNAHKGLQGIPVLASPDRLFVIQSDSPNAPINPATAKSTLLAFDLKALTVKWRLEGKYFSQPSVSPDVLYVLNGGLLEARSPDDGALLWSLQLDSPLAPSPTELLVTRSHVFVGNSRTTYAVELDKRKVAWTFPSGGTMAISDRGILYVANGPSLVPGVVAINLH